MSKEYYLYVNGQRVKVSEQIYKVYCNKNGVNNLLYTSQRADI